MSDRDDFRPFNPRSCHTRPAVSASFRDFVTMYGAPPVEMPVAPATWIESFPAAGIEDPEIVAIRAITAALAGLPDDARARVLAYVASRFGAAK